MCFYPQKGEFWAKKGAKWGKFKKVLKTFYRPLKDGYFDVHINRVSPKFVLTPKGGLWG